MPIKFSDSTQELELSLITVPKNSGIEKVRAALPKLKGKKPALVLEKTTLKNLPARIPEYDHKLYLLKEKERQLKQRENELVEKRKEVAAFTNAK